MPARPVKPASNWPKLRKIGPDTLIARHFESLILLRENKPDQALATALDILKERRAFLPSNLLAVPISGHGKGCTSRRLHTPHGYSGARPRAACRPAVC